MASRPSRRWAFGLSAAVLLAVSVAEVGSLVAGALPAAIAEIVLAVALVAIFALRPSIGTAPLLPALALACLIRPISLAAVLPKAPVLGWYVLAGLPMLAGALLAIRLLPTPGAQLHLRIRRPLVDLAVVAQGPLLGVLGFLALRPAPFFSSPGAADLVILAIVLGLFGAFTEELIFRGLVLDAAHTTLRNGPAAILLAAALPASLYAGTGSAAYVILMALAGLVFGSALLRGGSLWAVSASHGAMLLAMGLLAQASSH